MYHIENQANYYKNFHLRDRSIRAVVHVEDTDDCEFWDNQLQHVSPGKYHYISHSRNDHGNEAKGCEQCLKFRPFINKDFFICIDSDLRLLRHEEGLTSDNYIAQTYTYSWENHYCESNNLQDRFAEKTGVLDFNFKFFLDQFSRIVYRPLLLLVYCRTPELNRLWNITKFNQCIPIQPSQEDLDNNGKSYLQKIKNLFDDAISSLQLPTEFTIEGLTEKNAYLHIQGHQLYKLIRSIGTRLCKGKGIAFTSEVLNQAHQTSGYEEIDKVQSDLNSILAY